MNVRTLLLLLLLPLLPACEEENAVVVPDPDPEGEVRALPPLSAETMQAMEGVYAVIDGGPLLGDEVVIKHGGGALSLFAGRDAMWCFLDAGAQDSTLKLAGYWRQQAGTETGILRLRVEPGEGGARLRRGELPRAGEVTLRGEYGSGNVRSFRGATLTYRRPLYRGDRPFLILAHRAGGRNSDRLPASENSVELVRLADRLGATGVEIDVQISRDGVPIVYHDEYLNQRLTQKSGLVGRVGDYTIAQLEAFVRLQNGERIPTLKRMLAAILRHTTLRFVWLDSKYGVPMTLLRDMQRDYADSARALGRDLTVVIGLPDAKKTAELLSIPGYASARVLCELDVETARLAGAEYWAPRWTLGLQSALVEEMQAEGRRVLTWTLDDPAYIESYIREGRFDGILSNYPALVAYFYYTQ